jgi:hypothetical protein
MSRGTKKTRIGDAKMFEGGFGACILVGCFLSKIAQRSIRLVQVSAPEGYGFLSIPHSFFFPLNPKPKTFNPEP